MPKSPASVGLFVGPEGLLRRHAAGLAIAAVAGAAGSVATVALLALVNRTLHNTEGIAPSVVLAFLGLALAAIGGRAASNAIGNRIGQQVVKSLRLGLARRILAAPIDELERFKTHRLIPVLTHDVGMVSGLCLNIPYTVIGATVVLGCMTWLFWLSWQLALLLFVVMAIGTVASRVALKHAMAGFDAARESDDALHKAWQRLGDAAKELRLSRARRSRTYTESVLGSAERIARANIKAGDALSVANEFNAGLYFLFIAVVLGVAKLWNLSAEVLSGFVLALLFLKGPMDQVLGILPFMARARVSIDRVGELSERFANPELGLREVDRHPDSEGVRLHDAIELRGVRYAYQASEGVAPFVLGPVDMRIRRGELLFISGDNGSGKTTFLKLLTGLYAPQAGSLMLDGQPVADASRDAYRQLFSPVLSDFHLFEDLADEPGRPAALRDQVARTGLERLALANKVTVKDGSFSTTELSTGQRKRLALVHAWVEGRPVMVFDEWAADQDPSFRHQFYTVLLPELRAEGHTLIVISHDDRYFAVADRVVKFRDGKLVATA